jgi:hypothetical protein
LAASYLDFNIFDYFIWGWAKEMFYRAKPETSDIALGHIWDAADGIRKSKKLQRAKCGLQNQLAGRIVAGDGIF